MVCAARIAQSRCQRTRLACLHRCIWAGHCSETHTHTHTHLGYEGLNHRVLEQQLLVQPPQRAQQLVFLRAPLAPRVSNLSVQLLLLE